MNAGSFGSTGREDPNIARIYDYLLGGAHNFAVDREAAAKLKGTWPQIQQAARVNRVFLGEAVRYLAGPAGVRQFLDIGSGMPTMGNVHEVAYGVAPDTRVAYVDNDPVAVANSRILLARTPAAVAVGGDLHRPEEILQHPDVTGLLDLSQPVGLLLVAILHFFDDDAHPERLIGLLRDALPAGSYLVLTHATGDGQAEAVTDAATLYRRTTAPFRLRSRTEVLRFFDDCDLIEPGVVLLPGWADDRQQPRTTTSEGRLPIYAGIGRIR